ARRALVTKEMGDTELLKALSKRRPSPEAIKTSMRLMEEAGTCLDKTVEVAKAETQPYVQRAGLRLFQDRWRVVLRHWLGESFDRAPRTLSPECVADLRRAAELSPSDYRAIGASIWFEAGFLIERERSGKHFSWERVSENEKTSLRERLGRLEELA